MLIWGYLRRTVVRLTRLAARQGQPSRPRTPRQPAARPPRPKPPLRLPRGKSWLIRQVQETAFGYYRLQHLLARPEMAAWIAATPQAGRILRPLCRALGVPPSPGITRPPPHQATPAAPAPTPKRQTTEKPGATHSPAPPPTRRHAPRRVSRPAICGPPAPA